MTRSFGTDSGSGRDGSDKHQQQQQQQRRRSDNWDESAEEAQVARRLYLELVHEELQRNGIDEPFLAPPGGGEDQNHTVFGSLSWNLVRQDFHELVIDFSRSEQREQIRRYAQEVPGGVDRERIVGLFFFCSDLGILAMQNGLRDLFYVLLDWSLKFIGTKVALWVHRHGGWGSVLRTSIEIAYQVSACCAFVAMVIVCAMYLQRLQRQLR